MHDIFHIRTFKPKTGQTITFILTDNNEETLQETYNDVESNSNDTSSFHDEFHARSSPEILQKDNDIINQIEFKSTSNC